MNAAEEKALVARCKAGDRAAFDVLLRAHERFIHQRARRYSHSCDYDDLMQEARLGFVHAIRKFDAECGVRLLTYADRWIRNHLARWASNEIPVVYVPINTQRAVRAGTRVVGDECFEAAENVLRASVLRLDAPVDASSPGTTCGDLFADPSSTFDAIIEREASARAKDLLRSAMKHLPEREREIVTLRHLGSEERTLEEIGYVYGITKERVRQIVQTAEDRLRVLFEDHGEGDGFDEWIERLDTPVPKTGFRKISYKPRSKKNLAECQGS